MQVLLTFATIAWLGSSCAVFNESSTADSLRDQLQASFTAIDSHVDAAELFTQDFLTHTPTLALMQSSLTDLTTLQNQLVTAQAALTNAKQLKTKMTHLRMPDWYTGPYTSAVSDQISQRESEVTQYQEVLLKEQNFALAITTFYTGVDRFYAATQSFDHIPPLDPQHPEPLRKEVTRIQDEITLSTSDFNTAASYVNEPVFTRMRDSVVDFQQALNTLRQMTALLEDIQKTTDPDELVAKNDQMDQLYATLDAFLQTYSDSIPTEYLDSADGFTAVAIQEFSDWRTVQLDPLVEKARAIRAQLAHIDQAAESIYTDAR